MIHKAGDELFSGLRFSEKKGNEKGGEKYLQSTYNQGEKRVSC